MEFEIDVIYRERKFTQYLFQTAQRMNNDM